MRARARTAKLGDVHEDPRHIHLDMEFEVGSDPIRGRLGPDPGALREFQGWIELAAALEAMLGATAEPQ